MSLQEAPSITSAPRSALCEPSLGEIVDAARAGDEHAWTALVRRMEPRLRRVVRRFGLSSAQTDDVLQIAWLRLFENLGALRASEAVGAWLTVTARREALLMLQGQVHEVVTDDPFAGEIADAPGPEAELLTSECRWVVGRAIATLPDRHRRLMDLIVREPGLDYQEVSVRTGVPVGSIGPIRGRCLVRLAEHPEVQALRD